MLVLCGACAKKQSPLILLTESYPPLTYAEGDTITGYGAEVVAAIQTVLKTNYKPTMINWDKAYQRALNEPNIVIFTMEKTPERDSLFNWIGPLGQNKTHFYVMKESSLAINGLEDAKAIKSIGTVTDWFSEQYLKKQGFSNLSSSVNPEDAVRQLMTKKVDMAVFTDLTCSSIVQNAGFNPADIKPVFELMSTGYYIGISKKTDQATVDAWQQAFKQIEQDDTLAKLKEKWLP
jgi:polar amino acid transport system substrate-binding protein